MKLADILSADRVVLPLPGATVREAAMHLAGRLGETGGADRGKLEAAFEHAWPEAVVPAGREAVLPHLRTDAVATLGVTMGVAPKPLQWERTTDVAPRIVIFVAAPPREAARYLQVVGAFARMLADPAVVRAVLAARTPEDILTLPEFAAVELPRQLTVRDVMTADVVTITAERGLADAARLMLERDIRALPVVNETGGFIGMLTHRELLRYLIPDFVHRSKTGEFRTPTRGELMHRARDPRDMPVREAMDRTVLCLNEDQALSDVAQVMQQKNVDRFPVVREGVVVGFLTRADLVRRLVTL